MDVTRRWWSAAGAGATLVGLGVLAEQPVLLIGAAGLGAWLLAVAIFAVREFERLDDAITITYSVPATDAFVDTIAPATLRVERPAEAAKLPIYVQALLPPGIHRLSGEQEIELGVDTMVDETTFRIEYSIAGQFEFSSPTVTLGDPFGLYTTELSRGTSPNITVRPRTPDLHVGRGGEGARSAYGEHPTDRPGPGVTTRELRQYASGDAIQQIDWKATARLGEPYVRETEGETDRRMVVVFDHRGRMDAGRKGETMLEYAREVAIAITEAADQLGDPLGLWTVGDYGITTAIKPSTTPDTYGQIKSVLYEIRPTNDRGDTVSQSAARSRRIADRLATDSNDAFSRTLGTYVGHTETYVRRLRQDPLINTVRQIRSQLGSDTWIVILTNDDDPVRLQEAVTLATQGGTHAMVFLTPRCLFEQASMATLDNTYDRYLTFEAFRRDLESRARVMAHEIAPGDQLDAVLAHRKAETTTD